MGPRQLIHLVDAAGQAQVLSERLSNVRIAYALDEPALAVYVGAGCAPA